MSDVATQMPPQADNLFTVLGRSGIRLTEVHVGGLCKEMLEYLLSYSDTLQVLELRVSHSASNRPLATYLDNVLSNHQHSLRHLSISAAVDEGWVLGENNKDMLLVPLPVLDSLSVSVSLDYNDDGELERIIWYVVLTKHRSLN